MGKKNAQHLLNTVQQFYKCLCDWNGKRYCGLTIKWYIMDKKSTYQCPTTSTKPLLDSSTLPHKKWQDQPYLHVKPTYGAKKQYSQVEDNSPTLDKAGKKFIQEVC
jgi:hypothetical protein